MADFMTVSLFLVQKSLINGWFGAPDSHFDVFSCIMLNKLIHTEKIEKKVNLDFFPRS